MAFEAEFADLHVDGDGVLAGPAGGAIVIGGFAHAAEHAIQRKVGKRVDFDEVADLVDGAAVGDELGGRGEVDAEETGMADRRAGDAHVDFFGAGAAKCEHLAAGGGATDDGVFDDDDAFAFDHFGDDDEFHLHGEVAHVLAGLNEGAADIAIGDDAFFKGDAALLGIAEGGGAAAVGDGHDDVGIDGGFDGELAAHALADFHDHVAEEIAGRAGEIDVLERAVRGVCGEAFREETAGHFGAGLVDGDDFAGEDFADVGGLDALQGAGFGGEAVEAVAGLADDEGAEAPGIAAAFDAVGKQKEEAEGSLQMAEDVGEGIGLFLVGGLGEHVDDDFGIAGGIEDVAPLLIFVFEFGGVDEIAVVGDGDLAADVFFEDGLGVAFAIGAGGGVADVSDGDVAGEFAEDVFFEDVGDKTEAGVGVDDIAVGGGDAGGFLATVLEGVETVVAAFDGVSGSGDAEDSALFFFFAREFGNDFDGEIGGRGGHLGEGDGAGVGAR